LSLAQFGEQLQLSKKFKEEEKFAGMGLSKGDRPPPSCEFFYSLTFSFVKEVLTFDNLHVKRISICSMQWMKPGVQGVS
jgi:hypothetical protein